MLQRHPALAEAERYPFLSQTFWWRTRSAWLNGWQKIQSSFPNGDSPCGNGESDEKFSFEDSPFPYGVCAHLGINTHTAAPIRYCTTNTVRTLLFVNAHWPQHAMIQCMYHVPYVGKVSPPIYMSNMHIHLLRVGWRNLVRVSLIFAIIPEFSIHMGLWFWPNLLDLCYFPLNT